MSLQASPSLHRHNLGLDAKAVSAAAQICKDKSGAPAANLYSGSRPSQPGSGDSGGAGEGYSVAVMHQPRPPATFNITAGVLRPSPRTTTAACGDGGGGGSSGNGRSGRTNAELMEQVLLLSHVAQLAGGGSGSAQPLVRSGSLTKEHAP